MTEHELGSPEWLQQQAQSLIAGIGAVTSAADARQAEIMHALGEVKHEISGATFQIELLTNRVAEQNGRVRKLEDWRTAVDLATAKADGVALGKAEVLARWRNRDKAIVAALVAGAGFLAEIVFKLAEAYL